LGEPAGRLSLEGTLATVVTASQKDPACLRYAVPEAATFLVTACVGGQPRPMTDFDAVVVGGGAAGLSAALVLSRARRRVLVVDSGMPRNAPAAHMHGFLSRDGLPPAELGAIGRDEVKNYGATGTRFATDSSA